MSDFLLIFRLAPLRKNPVTRIIVQDNYRSISRVVTGAGTIARQIFVSSNFLSPLVSSNFNSTTVPSWKMDRGALTRYPGGEGGTVRNSNLNLTWDERRRTRYVLISCPRPTTVQPIDEHDIKQTKGILSVQYGVHEPWHHWDPASFHRFKQTLSIDCKWYL